MQTNIVQPSPEARQLFNKMVQRADDETMVLSLEGTLALCVELKSAGQPVQAADEVTELLDNDWICAHPAGGWQIN